jgi:hypothetical protein
MLRPVRETGLHGTRSNYFALGKWSLLEDEARAARGAGEGSGKDNARAFTAASASCALGKGRGQEARGKPDLPCRAAYSPVIRPVYLQGVLESIYTRLRTDRFSSFAEFFNA